MRLETLPQAARLRYYSGAGHIPPDAAQTTNGDMFHLQVPLVAVVGVAASMTILVVLLGAALLKSRARVQDEEKPLHGASVGPLLGSGGTKASAVQPATHSSFYNFFRGHTEPLVDPEGPKDEDYRGRINFSLGYDKETRSLLVHVLEAVDLKAMDMGGSSDPYVKVSLLPDRKDVKVTRIHRRTLNPKFAQTLTFPGKTHAEVQLMRSPFLK